MDDLFWKLRKILTGPFLHRETLRENLSDISFLGGVIIFLFFTNRNVWLTSINLPELRHSLTVGDVITLWNLFLATFPLTIGMCIILSATQFRQEESWVTLQFSHPDVNQVKLLT
jgi:hypothetical protein